MALGELYEDRGDDLKASETYQKTCGAVYIKKGALLGSDEKKREKALETYGYNFIRLNKFNTADDPVKFLDKKLRDAFKSSEKHNVSQ